MIGTFDFGLVDSELLRQQKQWLIDLGRRGEELEGLLSLIDALQDYAVDVWHRGPREIYGPGSRRTSTKRSQRSREVKRKEPADA